jgi:putative flippase GtrA
MNLSLLRRPDIIGDSFRFLVAGLVNTGLTILAYQAFLFYVSSQGAYALSWVLGLVFVAIVYPSRVFVGGRTDLAARIVFVAFYVGLFLLGLALMALLDRFGIPSRFSIFIVVGCTTLVNFITSRFLLRRR